MRKTRLVILPTKCLHQMGFLLLFLSCPVIGDWGRIRPESENLHNAIQIDREGTCGLQRDPPGKLLNLFYKNGAEQCQFSEDTDLDGISSKPIFREARRRSDERRNDLQRVARERYVRERNDEGKAGRKAVQRVADERINVRRELPRIHRDIREISQVRTRSAELRQSSKGRQQENEGATRRNKPVFVRRVSKEKEIHSNERERFDQIRRVTRRQNERADQQRRSVRKATSERRENERTIRDPQEMRERQTRRLFRSEERERNDIRLGSNRRSIPDRSLRMRESDVRERQIRERNQDTQNERLSMSRRKQYNRFESGRHTDNSESRLSQMRKTRITEIDGRLMERRMSRSENRRDSSGRKLSQRDVREGRVIPSSDKINRMDRMMEIKSVRTSIMTKPLPDNLILANKNADEKFFGGITKWINLKKYESLKAGDWTTNCVIGAVVYFLSTRQIKAV